MHWLSFKIQHPTSFSFGSCMKNGYLNHSTHLKPELRLTVALQQPRITIADIACPDNRELVYRSVFQTVFFVFNMNWKL